MNKPKQAIARHLTDALEPLPVVVVSWLGYLVVLFLIDLVMFGQPIYPMIYYVLNGVGALSVLVLDRRSGKSERSDHTLVLMAVALLSLLPILTGTLMVSGPPGSPGTGPESTTLRQMPLMLLGLVMVAWQYDLLAVVLYSIGSSLLGMAVGYASHATSPAALMPSLHPVVMVMLIQATSFLVVGYFLHGLFRLLADQHTSLERAHTRLMDYAETLEELTITRERNRMARELHDTLAHTLSALTVHLETTRAYLDVDPSAAAGLLDTAVATARAGLDDTRGALKALRASPLQDMGLRLALDHLIAEVAERAGFAVKAEVSENLPELPDALEHCIYRVAQEALANVAHHANASTVNLSLRAGEKIVLWVVDDGSGFDPDHAVSGHYGLDGMRERAERVGGTLDISSTPGSGTVIELVIPLSKEVR